MQTKIKLASDGLAEAVELLRAGQVVAFATETVYGVGADATNAVALQQIFKIKNRPACNPLIVHVRDQAQGEYWSAGFQPVARILAQRFWPGPLTMVLPRGPKIAAEVSAGLPTMAVRCPAHPVAQLLLAEFGRPIAAPSANLSGHVSPTSAADVLAELGGLIPLILDGGPCPVGVESTVVDVTVDSPVILRPGSVTIEMIRHALAGNSGVAAQRTTVSAAGRAETGLIRSPGMSDRHYAPRTPAYRYHRQEWPTVLAWLSRQPQGFRVVQLCFEAGGALPGPGRIISLPGNAVDCARELYSRIRQADQAGGDVILMEMPETCADLWTAIRDRISRATQELPQ